MWLEKNFKKHGESASQGKKTYSRALGRSFQNDETFQKTQKLNHQSLSQKPLESLLTFKHENDHPRSTL